MEGRGEGLHWEAIILVFLSQRKRYFPVNFPSIFPPYVTFPFFFPAFSSWTNSAMRVMAVSISSMPAA